MDAVSLELADGFPEADRDAWRRKVDRVLDRSGDLDESALEARFQKALVTHTVDGLRIDPLYTAADSAPDPGLPGQAPFVRGVAPLGHREPGWDVRQSVLVSGEPRDVASRVLEEFQRGSTQVLLRLTDAPEDGDALADYLDSCLEGVYLDAVTLALDAAGREQEVVTALQAVARRRGTDPAELRLFAGADPVGRWLRTAGTTDLDSELSSAAAWASQGFAERPAVVPLVADGSLVHECGGGDVEELGTSVALGVELLRALAAAGAPVDDAARAIEFRYAATPDQFLTIAKLRAARRLWQRVTSVSGAAADGQRQRQHAVASTAASARYDTWVNLLRTTLAAFGGGVGGADAVTTHPHDELVTPGGSVVGRRMARNAQLVLIEESSLARVVDLAGGSWYVESLTDQLAQAAWTWFQALEAAGGLVAAARSGLLQDRVDAVREARDREVATRSHPLTGVSEFPDILEEPPPALVAAPVPEGPIRALVPRRHSQPVELLRGRADRMAAAGRRPEVFLVTLGTPAVHTARATFAKNFFEAGGIRATVPGGFDDIAAAAAAYAESGAELACVCSSDDRYTEQAVATVVALRALTRPPRRLYLAGRPRGLTEPLLAAGLDEQVVAGGDIIDVLGRALDVIEAGS